MGGFLVIVGSIAAAGFGILGQVTELKTPTGRITRRARYVLLGIGASALLSLSGGAAVERENESAAMRKQEELLRTIWYEGNRVDAAAITVQVKYVFNYEQRTDPPRMLDENWRLSLVVLPPDSGAPKSPKAFWFGHPGDPGRGQQDREQQWEVHLSANSQDISTTRHLSIGGSNVTQLSFFSRFTGNMGDSSVPTRWNRRWVKVHLSASVPGLEQRIADSMLDEGPGKETGLKTRTVEEQARSNMEFLSRYYDLPDLSDSDASIAPLPRVRAEMTLLVRDRPIAHAEGIPAKVIEWDEDVRQLVVVDFPFVETAQNSFNEFPSRIEHGDRMEAIFGSWLGVLGWVLIGVIGFAVLGVFSYRGRQS